MRKIRKRGSREYSVANRSARQVAGSLNIPNGGWLIGNSTPTMKTRAFSFAALVWLLVVIAGSCVTVPGELQAGSIEVENKRLVRGYYEEVVSTGDIDRISEFIASDYAEVYQNIRHAIGVEGAKEHVLGVRRTYPDLRLAVEQQIAEGEWVVSRITMYGTHEGAWLGIEPTGKRLVVTAVNIDRVVDGRIVEHGGAANLLGPLLGIGAIQAVARGD